MILLGAAALYFPDSWVGRNIGIFMIVFGLHAYVTLATAAEDLCKEIETLGYQVKTLSRELEKTDRGLENVHERLWKVEHEERHTRA